MPVGHDGARSAGSRLRRLRRLAQWLAFPGILAGSLALTALLVSVLSPEWAIALVNVTAAAAIVVAERVLPYRASWAKSTGDRAVDIQYLGLNLAGAAVSVPVLAWMAEFALWIRDQAGGQLWPTEWPILVQVPLALIVFELGAYLFHSLSHRTWLWRFHAVHHSVDRLYWLNGLRIHPIDYVLTIVPTSGPLLILGIGDDVFAFVTVLGVVNALLQHSNIDTDTGFLDWVFVTPAIHRWHHSTEWNQQRCNLGAVLVVWDVVFRTRLAPDRPPPVVLGTGHPGYPRGFVAQLRSPWRRCLWDRGEEKNAP